MQLPRLNLCKLAELPIQEVRTWKSGSSAQADSYLEGVNFPQRQGSPRFLDRVESYCVNRPHPPVMLMRDA